MEKRRLRANAKENHVDDNLVRLMTYRCAVHGGMCRDGLTYDDIPEKIKAHFSLMAYTEIVRPLIIRDHRLGYTVQRMAILYRLTYSQVRYIVENFANL